MAILKPEGRYLGSNYGHLKPEGLAGQCLNSNYGHLKPEGLAGQCLEIFTFVVLRYEKSATGNFFVLWHKKKLLFGLICMEPL